MRICLDLRRPDDCGVGRVALNVAQILYHLTKRKTFELILLVTSQTSEQFGSLF